MNFKVNHSLYLIIFREEINTLYTADCYDNIYYPQSIMQMFEMINYIGSNIHINIFNRMEFY